MSDTMDATMRALDRGVFELDVPSPRPAVEHYLRVSVDVPGGCVEAALSRVPGEPLRPLRIQLADLIAEEALALNGDDLSDDNAGRLSDAMQARFASVWPGRAWWAELWLTGEVEDPLTQFYAPWGGAEMEVIHVEMGPRITFCGQSPADLAPGGDEVIADREWHENPEAVQRANCQQCLLRCFMLGDSASIALRHMGLKVDVHDVDPELQAEN